jgi:hypothetical protein
MRRKIYGAIVGATLCAAAPAFGDCTNFTGSITATTLTVSAVSSSCGPGPGPGPWQPPSRAWFLNYLEVDADGSVYRRGKRIEALTQPELVELVRDILGDTFATERGRRR